MLMHLNAPQHITQAVQQVLPQARVAWLFGSAAHGGAHFGPHSDIDLAVRQPQPMIRQLAEQLTQQAGGNSAPHKP
jgi:hypothetical protein